ncbi:aromatase/cyclase [Streptomyces sp. TLI_171]|uniref:aromatase/cyclase n=1 Tax=Streptomyces sp. TLI_171 TaxID=1938859 RepID=UPI000C407FBA|nr:aromatase/cyclase [Streptomyces sp. TLI_171]RKE19887.1 aromatase [Streptomyces sp. TLI_171]
MTVQITEVRHTAHEIEIDVPADTVHRLLAEVSEWPRIFPSVVAVEHEDAPAGEQRLRIWDVVDGAPRERPLRRIVEPAALRINFQELAAEPPATGLGGAWLVEPLGPGRSRVRLLHEFQAATEADLALLHARVEEFGRSELAGLKRNVEFAHAAEAATFSFEDTVEIAAKPDEVYDFIDRADLWAERLPHVAAVRLTEDTPHLQTLEMDTRAKDGSTHTTKSHRVTTPGQRIAYKQVTLPALLALHTGRWTFTPTPDGTTTATSQHTVTINTDRITDILGPHATLHDARTYVHDALSTNSRATLHHAKAHTEGGR